MSPYACPQCDEKDARIAHLVGLLQEVGKAHTALLWSLSRYGTQIDDLFGHDEDLRDAFARLKAAASAN